VVTQVNDAKLSGVKKEKSEERLNTIDKNTSVELVSLLRDEISK